MSRKVERIFTDASAISRHLFCPICTEVYSDPTRLFCGHTFCQKCIAQWNKKHQTCPVCRAEVYKELTGKDLIAENLIQELEVQCYHPGCQWREKLENLQNHATRCAFYKAPEWLSRVETFIEIDDDDETPLNGLINNENKKTDDSKTKKTILARMIDEAMQNSIVRENDLDEAYTFSELLSQNSKAIRKRRSTIEKNKRWARAKEGFIVDETPSNSKNKINETQDKAAQAEVDFFGLKQRLTKKKYKKRILELTLDQNLKYTCCLIYGRRHIGDVPYLMLLTLFQFSSC